MRINRVDSFRTAAMLSVIYLHTISIADPFSSFDFRWSADMLCGFVLLQVSRFAVPFFLIISGYFFGCKLRQGVDAVQLGKKYNSRILFALFFWNIVYLFSPALTENALRYGILHSIYWHARELILDPVNLIFQGTKAHLWFLISLLLAVWALALMVHLSVKQRNIFAFSSVLYCIGLLIGSYSSSPIGIHISLYARNFIFLSLPCFVIGWALSQRDVGKYAKFAVPLIGVGFAMQIAESYLIRQYWHAMALNGYNIGTLVLSTGIALAALGKTSNDPESIFSRIGRFALGIYGIHVFIIEMLQPLALHMPFSVRIAVFPFLVLMISTIAVYALSRTKLRPAVV